MSVKVNKELSRRLGFMPQPRPVYNVKYEVFKESILCHTTCPNCMTAISFRINGQTKHWTDSYISRSVAASLDRNHTAKCKARLEEYNMNSSIFYPDFRRGAEQQQERAYRILRGKEAPAHKA